MLSIEEIEALKYSTTMTKCHGCTNTCRLTINHFSGGRRFISGNRCERGLGKEKTDNDLPNLFSYKSKRYFHYESLPKEEAKYGVVGIPRVLNIYENYPFWHTFLPNLDSRSYFHRLPREKFMSLVSTLSQANPNVIRQNWLTVTYNG